MPDTCPRCRGPVDDPVLHYCREASEARAGDGVTSDGVLVAEIDASGSGKVYRVWRVNDDGRLLLWAHPSHLDGPLSHEARRLFVALGGPDE